MFCLVTMNLFLCPLINHARYSQEANARTYYESGAFKILDKLLQLKERAMDIDNGQTMDIDDESGQGEHSFACNSQNVTSKQCSAAVIFTKISVQGFCSFKNEAVLAYENGVNLITAEAEQLCSNGLGKTTISTTALAWVISGLVDRRCHREKPVIQDLINSSSSSATVTLSGVLSTDKKRIRFELERTCFRKEKNQTEREEGYGAERREEEEVESSQKVEEETEASEETPDDVNSNWPPAPFSIEFRSPDERIVLTVGGKCRPENKRKQEVQQKIGLLFFRRGDLKDKQLLQLCLSTMVWNSNEQAAFLDFQPQQESYYLENLYNFMKFEQVCRFIKAHQESERKAREEKDEQIDGLKNLDTKASSSGIHKNEGINGRIRDCNSNIARIEAEIQSMKEAYGQTRGSIEDELEKLRMEIEKYDRNDLEAKKALTYDSVSSGLTRLITISKEERTKLKGTKASVSKLENEIANKQREKERLTEKAQSWEESSSCQSCGRQLSEEVKQQKVAGIEEMIQEADKMLKKKTIRLQKAKARDETKEKIQKQVRMVNDQATNDLSNLDKLLDKKNVHLALIQKNDQIEEGVIEEKETEKKQYFVSLQEAEECKSRLTKQISAHNKEIQACEFFVKLLKRGGKFRQFITDDVVSALEARANRYLSQFFASLHCNDMKGSPFQIKLSTSKESEQCVVVSAGGGSTRVHGVSQSEYLRIKTALFLAYRDLSFGPSTSGIRRNVMVFDELFSCVDSAATIMMLDALAQLARDDDRLCIFVSSVNPMLHVRFPWKIAAVLHEKGKLKYI